MDRCLKFEQVSHIIHIIIVIYYMVYDKRTNLINDIVDNFPRFLTSSVLLCKLFYETHFETQIRFAFKRHRRRGYISKKSQLSPF
jgi:hypothetical protein